MTSTLVGQHSTHCATIPALSLKDWWLPVGQMNDQTDDQKDKMELIVFFSFFVMSRRFLPSHDNKWEIKKLTTRGITARKLFPTSMPIMMGGSVDWLTIRLDMFGHHHLFEQYWLRSFALLKTTSLPTTRWRRDMNPRQPSESPNTSFLLSYPISTA